MSDFTREETRLIDLISSVFEEYKATMHLEKALDTVPMNKEERETLMKDETLKTLIMRYGVEHREELRNVYEMLYPSMDLNTAQYLAACHSYLLEHDEFIPDFPEIGKCFIAQTILKTVFQEHDYKGYKIAIAYLAHVFSKENSSK